MILQNNAIKSVKKKKKIGVLDKTFYFNSSIEQIANYAENCIVVFPQGCSILV